MDNALECFTGGVPAGIIFQLNTERLYKLVEDADNGTADECMAEICFIALISYFEAFCKDHFASLINICPTLVDNLKQNGQDVTIDAGDVVAHEYDIIRKLGFVLAEKYNFSNARKINCLYVALLSITPFSKDKKEKYDNILADRNLLVHHGGAYTKKYMEQQFDSKLMEKRVYMDSLVISKNKFEETLSILKEVALTLINTSKKTLEEYIKSIGLYQDNEFKKAVNFINWWDQQ